MFDQTKLGFFFVFFMEIKIKKKHGDKIHDKRLEDEQR